jgi:hypothetical protein
LKVVGFKKNNILSEEADNRKKQMEEILKSTEEPKIYFSATKIDTFKTCPLKYKFQYIDKKEKNKENAPSLTFGVTYHKAMEYIYFCIVKNEKPDKEIINKIVEENLDRKMCTYMTDSEWEEFKKDCLKVILKYCSKRNKFSPLVVDGKICSELDFCIPLRNPITNEIYPNIYIRGTIDLLDENYNIIDFKTSSKAYSESKVNTAIQLTIYSYYFREYFKMVENGLLFDVAIKRHQSKSNPEGNPSFEVYKTSRSQKDYIRMFYLIMEMIKSEKYNNFYPNTPGDGNWCLNCEFKKDCENTLPIR